MTDARIDDDVLSALFDGVAHRLHVGINGKAVSVHNGERRHAFQHRPAFAFQAAEAIRSNDIRAPMPGRIVLVKVKLGDKVAEGDEVLVMEAMKMELTLRAPRAATVVELRAVAGEFVDADALLVKFEESK